MHFKGTMLTLAALLVAAAAQTGGYHLLRTIPLSAAAGGEYFDYVYFDTSARRVYASQGTQINVVSADTGKQIGVITGLKRDHGIAVVPGLNRGFITDGDAAEVVTFDPATFQVTGHIKTAADSDGILYEPVTKTIWCFEGDPNSVSIIDPATAKLIDTLPLGGSPEQAVADGRGMIYDNLSDKNEVAAIDAITRTVTARWPVAPAGEPVAMAMDRKTRRLFVGARNPSVMVELDANTGKVVGGPFPIGPNVDSCVFDSATSLAACSTRDGAIHVFREDTNGRVTVGTTIKTEFGAKTMTLDPRTHDFYTSTAALSGSASARRPSFKPGTLHLLVYGR